MAVEQQHEKKTDGTIYSCTGYTFLTRLAEIQKILGVHYKRNPGKPDAKKPKLDPEKSNPKAFETFLREVLRKPSKLSL